MTPTMDKILTLHPEGKNGTNIDLDKYEEMKRAILSVVPREAEGVPFGDLPKLVKPRLTRAVFGGASVTWYVTTVKLDLEARGLIERVPGRGPQRLRRVAKRR